MISILCYCLISSSSVWLSCKASLSLQSIFPEPRHKFSPSSRHFMFEVDFLTLWTILHSDGSPLPLYAPLLPYLHFALLQHFFGIFSDKFHHTLLIPSLIDAPPLHIFFRVSELVLACSLLHLFFGSTYHIAFLLLLLWLLFLRSHLRYRRLGALCTPSICKLQPFIFLTAISSSLITSSHCLILSSHISFSQSSSPTSLSSPTRFLPASPSARPGARTY